LLRRGRNGNESVHTQCILVSRSQSAFSRFCFEGKKTKTKMGKSRMAMQDYNVLKHRW